MKIPQNIIDHYLNCGDVLVQGRQINIHAGKIISETKFSLTRIGEDIVYSEAESTYHGVLHMQSFIECEGKSFYIGSNSSREPEESTINEGTHASSLGINHDIYSFLKGDFDLALFNYEFEEENNFITKIIKDGNLRREVYYKYFKIQNY